MASEKRGSLVCVGTGIRAIGQVTLEAKNHIAAADKVYYVCTDPVSEEWVRKVNPTAETLYTFYGDGKNRLETYRQMTQAMVDAVHAGQRVCGVFYGHPGVFAMPTHDAIRILRAEGYEATMQPGVSAEDNLYADLGIDPAKYGCQMYEATHLLATGRSLDTSVPAIIWQIGSVGDPGFNLSGFKGAHVPVLVEYLEKTYGPDHEVTVYEAAVFPGQKCRTDTMALHELGTAQLTGISTLYVPPKDKPQPDRDMIKRLKLRQQFTTRPTTATVTAPDSESDSDQGTTTASDQGRTTPPKRRGSLVCVGSGIRSIGQVTLEAKNHIAAADKVYCLCSDPMSEEWVRKLNPTAETLYTLYGDGKNRIETYRQMTQAMVDAVHAGQRVCGVFYGHPGVFATPTHNAIRILRAEGYEATMQPGVSAEDNLYADLGIDPAKHGCQMYEATHLLTTGRTLDPTATVIIWQISCVGELGFNLSGYTGEHVPALVEYLEKTYGPDHEVTVYEAAVFPGQKCRMDAMPLHELGTARLTGVSTLYVPPKHKPKPDQDMIQRLKLRETFATRPTMATAST